MRDNEHGFTLTETLVALFIMIAASTLLYRGFASGIAAASTVDGQQVALMVARSRLAAAGSAIPLEPGQVAGEADGGITWTLSVTPYAAPFTDTSADDDAPRLRAFWATVVVNWSDRKGARSLQLTTLKLGGVR